MRPLSYPVRDAVRCGLGGDFAVEAWARYLRNRGGAEPWGSPRVKHRGPSAALSACPNSVHPTTRPPRRDCAASPTPCSSICRSGSSSRTATAAWRHGMRLPRTPGRRCATVRPRRRALDRALLRSLRLPQWPPRPRRRVHHHAGARSRGGPARGPGSIAGQRGSMDHRLAGGPAGASCSRSALPTGCGTGAAGPIRTGSRTRYVTSKISAHPDSQRGDPARRALARASARASPEVPRRQARPARACRGDRPGNLARGGIETPGNVRSSHCTHCVAVGAQSPESRPSQFVADRGAAYQLDRRRDRRWRRVPRARPRGLQAMGAGQRISRAGAAGRATCMAATCGRRAVRRVGARRA